MYNPEMITAYAIAGGVVATMLFTAFKIVQSSHRPQQAGSKRSSDQDLSSPYA